MEGEQEQFYRVAYMHVKNRDDALDILHNAIVKALQKHHTLRNPEYLKTWFYKILINESISFIRKNKKMLVFDDLKEIEIPAVNSSIDKIEYIDLYEAIEKLPIKLKSVVILRYFEDLKLTEIAKITSAPLSTTKSRLYKALDLLKIDLEDIENDWI